MVNPIKTLFDLFNIIHFKTPVFFFKCSLTFGNSDLLGRYTKCAWDSDLPAADCVSTYMNLYGRVRSPMRRYLI